MSAPPPKEISTASLPEANHHHAKRRKVLWITTLSLIFVALLLFLLWFFYFRFHQSTDDAYVNGNMVNINAVVPGSVVAFYADDTQLVEEGQLLVELDKTAYRVKYEQSLATLAATVLQVRGLFDTVKANEALVAKKKVELQRAQFDFDNRASLVESQAVSNEEYEHAKDTLLAAQLEVATATHQYHVSIDSAGNTLPKEHPLIEKQKAEVLIAYYNLYHCSLYAPVRVFVAQRKVDVGESVLSNRNLLAIIPIDYVWVDANYKETQLRHMRIGQAAEVTLDIYGSGVKYKGKVLGIGFGTGSVFSLIPPQNATGNWIKIVQRIPVRISLDKETLQKFPPRLGLSAEVDVNITDRSLPRLATTPDFHPVGKTQIFTLDFSQVKTLMEEIIEKNFQEKSGG